MKKLLAVLLALFALSAVPRAYCADAKAELQELVGKVNAKIKAGAKSEADLAPELKNFDELLTAHKDEKTDEVASILLMKSILYVQVLKDEEKAVAGLQQLKTDFPGTVASKRADPIITYLARQVEAKKVQEKLSVGTPFPDFEVVDLDGKPFSLAGHKGRVVLVDFWATWCPPCIAEQPNMAKVYEQYHDQGFDIIGISRDLEKDAVEGFIKQKKLAWPQYFDGQGLENTLAQKYGISTLPATFLLDRGGKIIAKNLRGDELEAAVQAALAAK